jgi:DNA-binding transcriptional ArsR family regulator
MWSADLAASGPTLVFAALGDRTRLSILSRLAGGETPSIAALSADVDMSRQAVTKHLHVLEEAGLVSRLRQGRETRYGLRREALAEAQAYLNRVSAQWDEALGRLRALVEGAAEHD